MAAAEFAAGRPSGERDESRRSPATGSSRKQQLFQPPTSREEEVPSHSTQDPLTPGRSARPPQALPESVFAQADAISPAAQAAAGGVSRRRAVEPDVEIRDEAPQAINEISSGKSVVIEPGLRDALHKSRTARQEQIKHYTAPDGTISEEDVWVDFYNSDIEDYERTFASVLQQFRDAHLPADESADTQNDGIAELIRGVQGALVVDVLAPSGTLASLFEELPDDPDRVGITVSNTDQREDREIERDKRLGIQQMVDDITTPKALRNLKAKFGGKKVNMFLERGMGALHDLPAHPQYFRYMGEWMWNNLSPDNGIMLVQLPPDRFFERHGVSVPDWTEILDYNGVEYYIHTSKNSTTLLAVKTSDEPLAVPDNNDPETGRTQTAAETADAPITVVYRGVRGPLDTDEEQKGWHSMNRGFTEFHDNIRASIPEIEDIDNTLHDQIERAIADGREVVTVVDLGAGRSRFTKDFLNNPSLGEKTRAALTKGNIRLQFISVTDTETPDEYLQVTEFEEANTASNSKIDAKEIRYSITSSQNVKVLFDHLGIDSADMVVASNFMSYLTPQLFDHVTQDVIDYLEPGGQFLVHQYHDKTGSNLSRDDDFIPQDEPVWLKKKSDSEGPGVSTRTIIERSLALLSDTQATQEKMITAVREMYAELFDTELFSTEEKEIIGTTMEAVLPYDPRSSLEDLARRVYKKETTAHQAQIRRDKNAILDNLQESYGGAVEIRYRKHGIQIKKLATEAEVAITPGIHEETLFEAAHARIPYFQPVETNEDNQPRDRFGNTVIERQFIGEDRNDATEAYLVSTKGQDLIRSYPDLPSNINQGIEFLQAISGNHSVQEVGLGNGIALKTHNNEMGGGQSQTYILEINDKKYLISTHHPEGRYHQPYSNEMLQAQTLAADNKEALDSANMTMGSYLFASSEMMCTDFEDGISPRSDLEVYERFLDQYEKVRHVISSYIARQPSPLWKNVYPDWKVNNFIYRQSDGKFVFVDPFLHEEL